MTRTEYRTCHLCEATCGLELHLDGDEITLVRGDRDDVFSHGFLCPKGTAIKQLEADPDRVRTPLVRDGNTFREVSWDEAFAVIDAGLAPIREQHGPDALAVYLGNPSAHNLSGLVYNRVLLQAARTKNVYSASTVDQMPKQVSAGLMFGGALVDPGSRRRPHRLPVDARREPVRVERLADDRARHAGPAACVACAGRQARRRRSAAHEDRRRSRRASRDPARHRRLLLVRARARAVRRQSRRPRHRRRARQRARRGAAPRRRVRAGDRRARRAASTPQPSAGSRASSRPRRPPRCTRASARARRSSERSRRGSSTSSTCARATSTARRRDVHARRDRAAAAAPGKGRGVRFGRRESRVRGLPEFFGELPGRVPRRGDRDAGRGADPRAHHGRRATPRSSTPNSERLDRALGTLDFMVSLDIYVNETTRHAERDPAAREGAVAQSLRPRALQPRDPQRRELLAADRRPRAGRSARVAHDAAARGRAQRARTEHRCRRARRLRDLLDGAEGRGEERRQRRREGCRRDHEGAGAASRSGAHPRLHAARRRVRRRVRQPTPTACRSQCSRRIRTASTWVRCNRASRTC